MNSIFSKLHTSSLVGTGIWIVFAMSGFAQTDTGRNVDNSNGMKMGMKMMAQMRAPSMQTSALPDCIGTCHIYHIGSISFFLDHSDQLGLSTYQLNQIKRAAVLAHNEFDRPNEAAEQALWVMTSEGQPDGFAIEKQLVGIGVWSSQTRLNFIQAVGKAAEVLTFDQRTKLVGKTGDEETTSSNPHDHKD